MDLWLEQNLFALVLGLGLGIVVANFLDLSPLLGALAGVAVALPVWQITQR